MLMWSADYCGAAHYIIWPIYSSVLIPRLKYNPDYVNLIIHRSLDRMFQHTLYIEESYAGSFFVHAIMAEL